MSGCSSGSDEEREWNKTKMRNDGARMEEIILKCYKRNGKSNYKNGWANTSTCTPTKSRDIPARTLEGPLKKAAAWATSNAIHTTKIPALMLDKVIVCLSVR